MATHSVSMQGIGEAFLTAKKGTTVTAGYPCGFSANDTVANTAANGTFCGIAAQIRGTLVTVQYQGFVTLPYTGATAPSVGYGILVANGSGGVSTAQSGRSYLISAVDTSGKTVTFML